MSILIIGAGGHAQVVADILLQCQERDGMMQPLGYVDDCSSLSEQRLLGLPASGTLSQIVRIPHDGIVVAIGDNVTRARLFTSLRACGERIVNVIHPSAVISRNVSLGIGVMCRAGVVVNPGTVIGDNVIINTHASVDHHNQIGDHVHIAPGAHLAGNVRIETGSFVGIGATVIPGRTVGDWTIVGAGAVVTVDIPPRTTSVGVPARVIKWHDAYEKNAA